MTSGYASLAASEQETGEKVTTTRPGTDHWELGGGICPRSPVGALGAPLTIHGLGIVGRTIPGNQVWFKDV